jgi:hypothetical protein
MSDAVEKFAQFLEFCAESARGQAVSFRKQADHWERQAEALTTSAAQVRERGARLEPLLATDPLQTMFDQLPSATAKDAAPTPKQDLLPLEPSQPRGLGDYDHDAVQPGDATPENTRRRLYQIAGLLWPELKGGETRDALLEFASTVLGQRVQHTSKLRRRDAWRVCQELEAQAAKQGIGELA